MRAKSLAYFTGSRLIPILFVLSTTLALTASCGSKGEEAPGVRISPIDTSDGLEDQGCGNDCEPGIKLDSIDPPSGPSGTLFTIRGENLLSPGSETKVYFNDTQAPLTSVANDQIDGRIPFIPGIGGGENLRVTLVFGEESVAEEIGFFALTANLPCEGVPAITDVSPDNGQNGNVITVQGRGFDTDVTVSIGGQSPAVTRLAGDRLTFAIPELTTPCIEAWRRNQPCRYGLQVVNPNGCQDLVSNAIIYNDGDPDADGLLTSLELITANTDPLDADSDDDGLDDGFEWQRFSSRNCDPNQADTDGNGYSDREDYEWESTEHGPLNAHCGHRDHDRDNYFWDAATFVERDCDDRNRAINPGASDGELNNRSNNCGVRPEVISCTESVDRAHPSQPITSYTLNLNVPATVTSEWWNHPHTYDILFDQQNSYYPNDRYQYDGHTILCADNADPHAQHRCNGQGWLQLNTSWYPLSFEEMQWQSPGCTASGYHDNRHFPEFHRPVCDYGDVGGVCGFGVPHSLGDCGRDRIDKDYQLSSGGEQRLCYFHQENRHSTPAFHTNFNYEPHPQYLVLKRRSDRQYEIRFQFSTYECAIGVNRLAHHPAEKVCIVGD